MIRGKFVEKIVLEPRLDTGEGETQTEEVCLVKALRQWHA